MRPTLGRHTSGDEPVFIVSSALEATWPRNQFIVFLGDWCLRYSRRQVWQCLNYSTMNYHWDDRNRIPHDLAYISNVYERLLSELARKLNQVHGVQYSLRYWRITVGWWLFYFAQVFFDRWQVLKQAEAAYPNARMLRMPVTSRIPASADTAEFSIASTTDHWNERLSADIAEYWTNIQVETTNEVEPRSHSQNSGIPNQELRLSMKTLGRRLIVSCMNWMSRWQLLLGARVSMTSDYLQLRAKLSVATKLRQLPTFDEVTNLPRASTNPHIRNWRLLEEDNDPFAFALATFVSAYLPTCFLEGYSSSALLAHQSRSIRPPHVIMTANAFSTDDRWKLLSASQTEKGAKLVIAQHGGHYGVGSWSASLMHEIAISDRYLSWGWRDLSEPKIYPAPATRLIGLKAPRSRANGRCLQVTTSFPRQSYWLYSAPIGPQASDYLDAQLRFAAALSAEVRDSLTVRLSSSDYGWDIADRWADSHPGVTTDLGLTPMSDLLADTRLFVATYNATTFLESFTMCIPTVIFWNPAMWELTSDASLYFEALKDASIFFDHPEKCAAHINAIWHDPMSWWMSSGVQTAVAAFVERFAYVGPHPESELVESLTTWI